MQDVTCELFEKFPGVMPGWGCCTCKEYNGAQRTECRTCGHQYCGPRYEVVKREKLKNLLGEEVEAITEIRRQ
jgi:hypothetical protein